MAEEEVKEERRALRRFTWIFIALNVFILSLIIIAKFSHLSHSTLVTGKVTSIGKKTVGWLGGSYRSRFLRKASFPIIDYQYKGRTYTYYKPTEILFLLPGVGSEVTIVVDNKNPQDVRLYRFFGFWFTTGDLILLLLLPISIIGVADVVILFWRGIVHGEYE